VELNEWQVLRQIKTFTTADTDTGIYTAGVGELSVAVAGAKVAYAGSDGWNVPNTMDFIVRGVSAPSGSGRIRIPNNYSIGWRNNANSADHTIKLNGSNLFEVQAPFALVDGAVGAPSYSFSDDPNTGMWSSANETINFSTAGVERVEIDSTGIIVPYDTGVTLNGEPAARIDGDDAGNTIFVKEVEPTASAGDIWVDTSAVAYPIQVVTSSSRPTADEGRMIYEADNRGFTYYDTEETDWLPPWNLAWGALDYAESTTAQTAISTLADLTSLSVTFNAVAGRRYKFTALVHFTHNSVTLPCVVTLVLTDNSNTQIQEFAKYWASATGSHENPLSCVYDCTTTGSETYKLRGESSDTVNTSPASTEPDFILIEDIGPTVRATA